MYVFKSEAGIVFIDPPSLTTIPSASAKVIELPTDVPPSNRFNSAAVAVTAVPLIANLSVTMLNVALSSILATSVPSLCWNIISLASTIGLIITSLDELVILKTSVPPALKLKSLPPASKIRSAAQSIVKLLADIVKSVPSPSIFSESPPKTIPTSF